MEIRVLGPVELKLDGRPVLLGGPKQRAVLSLLALNANSTVSVDRMIEGLWGEQEPPSAAKNVQLYVSQLRKLLAGQRGAEIVTHGRAYELRLDPEVVDALRFERLIRDASDRRRNGGAGEAANRALSLWRGPPLADLLDEPFAAAETRRLEELRLAALELAVESDLERGRAREQIACLDSLVAEHPLRERLHYLRMLALYRAGRQADALEAYGAARAALVDAVGAEPGPELRRLHEEILRQDPALDLEVPELAAELTPDVPVLGGREPELALLRSAWRETEAGAGRVVLVQGPAGIGKTRLAAELAGELHSEGASVIYVGGVGPGPAAALERARRTAGPALVVLDDLDRAPAVIVTGAAELAGSAAERPLLVVLAYRDDPPSAAVSRLAGELEAQGAQRLALRPLGAEGVREIAALYAGERAAAAPLARLLEASGVTWRRSSRPTSSTSAPCGSGRSATRPAARSRRAVATGAACRSARSRGSPPTTWPMRRTSSVASASSRRWWRAWSAPRCWGWSARREAGSRRPFEPAYSRRWRVGSSRAARPGRASCCAPATTPWPLCAARWRATPRIRSRTGSRDSSPTIGSCWSWTSSRRRSRPAATTRSGPRSWMRSSTPLRAARVGSWWCWPCGRTTTAPALRTPGWRSCSARARCSSAPCARTSSGGRSKGRRARHGSSSSPSSSQGSWTTWRARRAGSRCSRRHCSSCGSGATGPGCGWLLTNRPMACRARSPGWPRRPMNGSIRTAANWRGGSCCGWPARGRATRSCVGGCRSPSWPASATSAWRRCWP